MAAPDSALSFGMVATEYDRFRPRYPSHAISWATGTPPPAQVIDLGAGTGILTRSLLQLGYAVVPVEPDGGMRAQLARTTVGVTPVGGTAEAVPLISHSADAILIGQAYHWFDRNRAHAEAGRLLRPGGFLAALWNLRDETEPWVGALSAIADEFFPDHRARQGDPRLSSFGDRFGDLDRTEYGHHTVHDTESLVAMMRTRSYYLTAGGGQRRAYEERVHHLVATHPDLAGRARFRLPYRTVVYRGRRR